VAGAVARVVDEFDGGFGWICDERLVRTSHALRTDDGVWLVDPVAPDVDPPQLAALAEGDVVGVLQLLDRHERDGAAFASRFRARYVGAFESTVIRGSPFELVPVVGRRWWREVALWWPERRVLVCADALGTVPFFRAPGERIGVHPLLRLTPPTRLRGLAPARILVGHGAGVHDDAAAALDEALSTSRQRAPAALAQGLLRAARGRRASRRP